MRKKYTSLNGEQKRVLLDRMRTHIGQGEVVESPKGGQFFWDKEHNCGDLVGCMVHSADPAQFEKQLGLQSVYAYMITAIYRGLPAPLAALWPERFLNAIPCERDLFPVWHLVFHDMLANPMTGLCRLIPEQGDIAMALSTVAELCRTEADEERWRQWYDAHQQCQQTLRSIWGKRSAEPAIAIAYKVLEAASYMADYGASCNAQGNKVPFELWCGRDAACVFRETAEAKEKQAEFAAASICDAVSRAVAKQVVENATGSVGGGKGAALLPSIPSPYAAVVSDIAQAVSRSAFGTGGLAVEALKAAGLSSAYTDQIAGLTGLEVATPLLGVIIDCVQRSVRSSANQRAIAHLADTMIKFIEAVGQSDIALAVTTS